MKSHRATSFSARANLSRWSLEFFCEPGTELEWFDVLEELSAINWLLDLGIQ